MRSIIDKALSPKVLGYAWNRLKKDRGLWSKGIPVQVVERNQIQFLGELVEQVKNGTYRPEVMRCHEIDKADGGKRLICSSAARDKLLQRAVLTVMEPVGEALFDDHSYGFRPSCTLDMAMSAVRERVRHGDDWIVDADIRQCFDTIPQKAVIKQVKRYYRDKTLIHLIELWMGAMPASFVPVKKGLGLPQGMVLSPFLSNLYLHQMDQFWRKKDIDFVRFADDFVLLLANEKQAQKALKITARMVKGLGLNLHPGKTNVFRSNPRYRFLGKRFPKVKEVLR